MPVKPAIIPCLWYKDATTAIDFLCRAFGFEAHFVHPDDRDPSIIAHAQLVRDGQMIMISSYERGDDSDFRTKARALHPADAGGNTMTPYIVIDDVDGHAERARAAGIEVVMEPKDEDYGGRGYVARDPEGYVWSFGNYDPWAKP